MLVLCTGAAKVPNKNEGTLHFCLDDTQNKNRLPNLRPAVLFCHLGSVMGIKPTLPA